MDQYRVISDWRAFAILNLILTKDFQSNPKWIAKRLGISLEEVTDTVERLKRLEMLKVKNGKLQREVSKYRTTEDISNMSLQQSHQQTLELALSSLEKVAVAQRDYTWLTFPMDSKKMAIAKTLIRKFQNDFLALVGEDAQPNEVYRLAIQLFPLTKVAQENGETK